MYVDTRICATEQLIKGDNLLHL